MFYTISVARNALSLSYPLLFPVFVLGAKLTTDKLTLCKKANKSISQNFTFTREKNWFSLVGVIFLLFLVTQCCSLHVFIDAGSVWVGELTREQFTHLTHPVPREVNTHWHTWRQTEGSRAGKLLPTQSHTSCEWEELPLMERLYFLKNKHTHTRSFRQPHTYSWTAQWSSVIPLKHSANWRIDTTLGGGDYSPWSLFCYQSAHAAASTPFLTLITLQAPHFRIENKAHDHDLGLEMTEML